MRSLLLSVLLLGTPAVAAAPPAAPHPGEQVYRTVCQACHMADAKGATGAGRIPALAGNRNLSEAGYPIMVVTGGKGAMPWFRGDLSDQQIADVISYVRTHFGNNFKAPVTAAMIGEMGMVKPVENER